MINRDMRMYDYSMLGAEDAYGQQTLDGDMTGQVKMALYVASQQVGDSILYREAQYIGLTTEAVDDRYIIHNGSEKLKVLYVQQKGKHKQVYLQVTA